MKDFAALLALPASILTLLSSSIVCAQDSSPPESLPELSKRYTEHEALIRREWEASEKLAHRAPVGVKKMSGDEGEKFFLHYWDFGDGGAQTEFEGYDQPVRNGNASSALPLLPGIAPHSENNGLSMMLFGRSLFARDFKCPGDTYSCSGSIGANICCHPGQNCVSTDDGPGCCPAGDACGESIGECSGGYTSCNGGCCIPGAVCKSQGCVLYGTETTTTLQTVTRTSGATSTTITGSGRTVTVFQPTTRISTKTVIVGTDKDTTTTVSPSRPILPVSVSATTQSSNTACLPGYYMCSAHYLGGCCKVNRDCDTTHCPPTGTTILVGPEVTVVESAPTGGQKTCNLGLYSCPASAQGGCCPSDYHCAIESCIAGTNGFGDVAKLAPSSANVLRWAGGFLVLGVIAGSGMILL